MESVTVTVHVPASTANLGPGFDCLGLALGLHNSVEIGLGGPGLELHVEGYGSQETPRDGSNLIVSAAHRGFQILGQAIPAMRIKATNRIPLASGLGSSAAAIISGLAAANHLAGGKLTKNDLLGLASELDGHPDNVAASLFGGLTLVGHGPDGLLSRRISTAELKLVIAVPDLALPTVEMRRILPEEVPLADAVANLANCAFTIEALREGDFALLSASMVDRLHQPYRKQYIPAYDQVFAAALSAGAASMAISGSGPSMIAFAANEQEAISEAMSGALESQGVQHQMLVLPVDDSGLQVVPSGSGESMGD